jgi:hypothetical protein
MAEKVKQKYSEKFMQNSAKGWKVMERMCKHLEAEPRGSVMWSGLLVTISLSSALQAMKPFRLENTKTFLE